ncbi:unnamed protein product [Protopolystoma xenopodis]|uniref:Uncharacterized protein n=1 Tax=Protopolystoma xenopodis TaxID=117903 RepID=A0A3S5CLU0_9PLAT|nr:unnamed protein product [Protopolystoma xenopodis]
MDNYKGDALKLAPRQQSVLEAIYEDASNTESCGDQLEQYCSLEVISDSGTAEKADEGPIDMTGLFRQEKCILTTLSNFDPLEDEYSSLAATLINYRLPRNGRANIKLVVSDQRLAEEYSSALADLAKAAEGPDMVHFRERLEDFRARLRRDVGRSVKVARGEWEAWRAKSARSVATLRNQSSAAAQKMRAGLSHGVEQMKDGMRSMAELCGATGTIGQTISVVSVYVDEADQIKKERVISDFVF